MLVPVSLTAGELGITGLLWTLILGDTALRLNRFGSKSSSRRRFLLNSNIEIGCVAIGVEQRELGLSLGFANSEVDPIVVEGVISMERSSSDTEVPI